MNRPDPCENCHNNISGSCKNYDQCGKWLSQYRRRQRAINRYAEKVLPAYYAQNGKGARANG